MKSPLQSRTARQKVAYGRRGIAILWTLGVLILLSVLVVGTLTVSERDRTTSRFYAQSSETKLLSQTAANIVIGQIRAATTNLGTEKTWASQPGAVRVFSNELDRALGRAPLESIYKLYSDETMVVSTGDGGSGFDPADDLPPDSWQGSSDIWTDINEGVAVSGSESSGTSRFVYPIAKLHSNASMQINGFEASSESTPGESKDETGIPMPVKWLYMLKDGRVVAPTNDSGDSASFGEGGPTEENPIVGRVAFWTDDESCKVNINTASESVFWDSPFCNGNVERELLFNGPVRNEFQRYPGHPATTSLSAVLNPWLKVTNPYDPVVRELLPYWLLAPRITDGGSRGGTEEIFSSRVIRTDRDRIYASVDEFSFGYLARQSRNQDDPSGVGREPYFDNEFFKIAPFLLTSHSRAPEVNVFNKPRISLWPLQLDKTKRTAVDQLIEFCGTANGQPYFLQRAGEWTRYNQRGSSQSAKKDMKIDRNEELYQYLLNCMKSDVPGFGSSFLEKYKLSGGGSSDLEIRQLAIQFMDYIRSSVNTFPYGLSPEYRFSPKYGNESARSIVPAAHDNGTRSTADDVRGFGRFITPTEAMLVFHPSATGGVPVAGDLTLAQQRRDYRIHATEVSAYLVLETATVTPGFPGINPHAQYRIRGLGDFKINGQSLNFPRVAQLDAHTPIGHFSGAGGGVYLGGLVTFRTGPPNNTSSNVARKAGTDPRTEYTFASQSGVPLSGSGDPDRSSLSFGGGTLQIDVLNFDGSEVLQTLQMEFPDTDIPLPYVQGNGNIDAAKGTLRYDPAELSLSRRLAKMPRRGASEAIKQWTVRPGDVARSIEASAIGTARGDIRHITGKRVVDKSYFAPHPSYALGVRARFAEGYRHSMWQWNGNLYTQSRPPAESDSINPATTNTPANQSPRYARYKQATMQTAGVLVPDATYFRDSVPAVPTSHPIGSKTPVSIKVNGRPGDWDTGMGILEDAPSINKTDESNVAQEDGGDSGKFNKGAFFNIGRGSWREDKDGLSSFPNKQIASAIQMGSLPSGIHAQRPWETLLFCPNPPSRTTSSVREPNENDHTGFGYPRDHLLADLFWMPVVEPYAISEPLSTSGKINLNHQILPFTYVRRDTGIRAVLNKMKIMAMPADAANSSRVSPIYKEGSICPYTFRYGVNVDETLRGIDRRFDEGDIYRSASEICDIYMVPQRIRGERYYRPPRDPKYENMGQWWNSQLLTGDNVRERPYNQIYPRLTTKSNVFRVHVRVETLKKARSAAPDEFDSEKDLITGNWRGSFLLERFIDPNDPALPDFAGADPSEFAELSLDDHYRFRVLEVNEFFP